MAREHRREESLPLRRPAEQCRPEGEAWTAMLVSYDPDDLKEAEDLERDSHGNARIAEINIGEILKARVQARLTQFGIKTPIAAKNIGYELRCATTVTTIPAGMFALYWEVPRAAFCIGGGVARPQPFPSTRAAPSPSARSRPEAGRWLERRRHSIFRSLLARGDQRPARHARGEDAGDARRTQLART